MRKKQIIILGVVLGLSLLGLIFTQARYFQTAFQLKKAHFDYLVNKSIDQVTTYLEEKISSRWPKKRKTKSTIWGKMESSMKCPGLWIYSWAQCKE